MPTRLRKLKITRVAVCQQGANYDVESGEGAHILLFKSADAEAEALDKAERSTAGTNDLPDSAFAYISPGGTKDEDGKTVPRSLRHLPYKTASGAIDKPHLRNALARLTKRIHITCLQIAVAQKRRMQCVLPWSGRLWNVVHVERAPNAFAQN